MDAALISALPRLGAIVHFGVGYDTTDVDAAAARGIAVSNTPDVLTDCVADTAVGLMIDTLRQFSAADRYVRAGRWPSEGNYPLTRQVSGSRVGIIGLGRIGGAIATRSGRVRVRHLLPQPPPRGGLPVRLRGLAGRAGRSGRRAGGRRRGRRRHPASGGRRRHRRRSGRTGI